MQEMLPSSWTPYVNSCSIPHLCLESENNVAEGISEHGHSGAELKMHYLHCHLLSHNLSHPFWQLASGHWGTGPPPGLKRKSTTETKSPASRRQFAVGVWVGDPPTELQSHKDQAGAWFWLN